MTTPKPTARHALGLVGARRRRWRQGWAAALRLARRDAFRHRGGAVLIMVLIGLPVLVVTGASAFVGTTTVSVSESVPAMIGAGQARLGSVGGAVDGQSLDGTNWSTSGPAIRADGSDPYGEWTARQLAELTGAPVTAVGYPRLVATGASPVAASALALDPALQAASGLVTLESGRWPRTSAEVLVTETGRTAGLPAEGAVTLRAGDGVSASATVVGVAAARDPEFRPVDLVVGPQWAGLSDQGFATFLVLGDLPVDWTETRRLNASGLVVLSPTVLADPPAPTEPGVIETRTDTFTTALVAVICLGLVLETTLLAGPAFAVSAARRRRVLALVAANGGDRRQLTRLVLAQGVVLGGSAAAVGAIGGTALGWVVARIAAPPAQLPRGPLDLFLPLTVAVTVASVVAALTASAVPARAVGRTSLGHEIVGVRTRQRPVTAVAGIVLTAGGVAALLLSPRVSPAQGLLVVGAATAGVVLGFVLLLSRLVSGVGAVVRRTPLPVRLAGRDIARTPGRSVPAVAAITVAVMVLTMLAVGLVSGDARTERDYRPQALFGHGVVVGGEGAGQSAEVTLRVVKELHPDWRIGTRGLLGDEGGPDQREVVAAVAPGCTAAVALGSPVGDEVTAAELACRRLGSDGEAGLLALPSWGMPGYGDLTADQRSILSAGGVLVGRSSADLIVDARLRLAVGRVTGMTADRGDVTRVVSLPAGVVDDDVINRLSFAAGLPGQAVLASDALVDLPLAVGSYEVATVDDDPITAAEVTQIDAAGGAVLTVERGWYSGNGRLLALLVVVAVALAVLAAVIATALTQTELVPDLATLAAVGSAPSLRLCLASAHACLTAGTGAVVGIVVGLGPAIAMARILTADRATEMTGAGSAPPIVAVPWLALVAVVVLVPALAAAAGLLVAGRPPVLLRRQQL